MKPIAGAIILLLATWSAAGAQAPATQATGGAPSECAVEILQSEELPGAPIFQTRMRVRLLITPPGQAPIERSVEKLISWQNPPPRRGQRLLIPCDPTSFNLLMPSLGSDNR